MARTRARILSALAPWLTPVLVLVVVEGALRLWWPQPAPGLSGALIWKTDGLRFMMPSVQGRQSSREFSVHLGGNRHGYRAGTWANDNDPSGLIWIFGDSFAFGWGVEPEQSAASLLTARGLRVADFAFPSDGVFEYSARLRRALAAGWRPGRLVFVLYDNDFVAPAEVLASSAPPRTLAYRARKAVLGLHLPRLLGRMAESLGLGDLVARVTGTAGFRNDVIRPTLAVHRRGALESPTVRGLLRDLESLLRFAQGTEVRVNVVRVTPVYATGGPATDEVLAGLQERKAEYDFDALAPRLAAVCAAAGVPFAVFGPSGPDQERDWYFRFDTHLTVAGQRALADRLEAELRR